MRWEHWLYTVPLRLRSLFRRSHVEQELEEELQFHIRQRIEEGIERGQAPEEARYQAIWAIQGIEQRKEECRDARRVRWLEDLTQDAQYAVRTLSKTPSFTAVAVLVLALGIGANTAVFTIVNGILLRPLPFNEPDRLFLISSKPTNNPFIQPGPDMSDRDFLEFRRQDRLFESIATFGKEPVTLTGAGDAVVLNTLTATPDLLRILRVHPSIGRDFLPAGQVDTNAVLLSHKLWHSRWGGDPATVGKSITLDGVGYTVVGILPVGFSFQDAELWKRMEIHFDPHNAFMRPVIGRLKSGASPEEAKAEVRTFAARRPLNPGEKPEDFVGRILPLRELFAGDMRELLLIFAGAVAFVFLIACANFANLLLIRGASRQQEIAVRAALGASRSRLMRQLLAESTLLSLAGGVLGIVLSMAGVRVLLTLLPPGKLPHSVDIQINSSVLIFTFALSLLTGLVFGVAPSLQTIRGKLRATVGQAGRSTTRQHEKLRNALVTTEIALALVLLTGAGLLVKSFLRIRSVNPGFRPANLLAITVDLPTSRYRTAGQMRTLGDQILAKLAALPGAGSVAAVNWIPFKPELVRGDFQIEGGRHLPRGFLVGKPVISSRYFRTMGIKLLSGRAFTERDNAAAPGVAIISESVARRLWPAGDAIGKRISMEDAPKPEDWLTIIGIVHDVKQQTLTDTPSMSVYQPYEQVKGPFFLSHMSFVLQTIANSTAMASGIRAVIHKVDRDLPAQTIATMQSIIADTTVEPRSQMLLLEIFSAMAVLLAAIGVYGVLACSVAERTHEIGIRISLGAQERDVLWMVFRRTLVLTGSGVLFGVLGALAVTRVLAKFLFEVTPTDPTTFLAGTMILILVALVSAWIPAQRAAQVYPVIALRHQ